MTIIGFDIHIKVSFDLSEEEQEELEDAIQNIMDEHEANIIAEVRSIPAVKECK